MSEQEVNQQEVRGGAEQAAAGDGARQIKIDLRIGEGGNPNIRIGAVYTGPVHLHIRLDLGER